MLRKVMQRYARSCNVPQAHATSCKVMQSHVIMQGKSHTSFVNFTVQSRRFTCIQAFSGGWRGVVVYHRWSLESELVPFMMFIPETILVRWTLQKSNFLQFRSINEHEGVWSADSG